MQKAANIMRLFWGCIFIAGVIINGIFGVADPEGYHLGGRYAWPDFLRNFWTDAVIPHMVWFIILFAAIELILGFLVLNKGRLVKIGLVGAFVFGIGLLMLGLGAERGDWLARIPNIVFVAMMIYCLLFNYDKTLIETIRRK
ncbi:MAG: hypothetical protein FWF18_04520 [Dehalococcoidia bacterium]|nr:hypothetical protein [Dehalococcoidia bacterium]